MLGRHLAQHMYTVYKTKVLCIDPQQSNATMIGQKTGFLPGTLLGMLSLYHYDADLNLYFAFVEV